MIVKFLSYWMICVFVMFRKCYCSREDDNESLVNTVTDNKNNDKPIHELDDKMSLRRRSLIRSQSCPSNFMQKPYNEENDISEDDMTHIVNILRNKSTTDIGLYFNELLHLLYTNSCLCKPFNEECDKITTYNNYKFHDVQQHKPTMRLILYKCIILLISNEDNINKFKNMIEELHIKYEKIKHKIVNDGVNNEVCKKEMETLKSLNNKFKIVASICYLIISSIPDSKSKKKENIESFILNFDKINNVLEKIIKSEIDQNAIELFLGQPFLKIVKIYNRNMFKLMFIFFTHYNNVKMYIYNIAGYSISSIKAKLEKLNKPKTHNHVPANISSVSIFINDKDEQEKFKNVQVYLKNNTLTRVQELKDEKRKAVHNASAGLLYYMESYNFYKSLKKLNNTLEIVRHGIENCFFKNRAVKPILFYDPHKFNNMSEDLGTFTYKVLMIRGEFSVFVKRFDNLLKNILSEKNAMCGDIIKVFENINIKIRLMYIFIAEFLECLDYCQGISIQEPVIRAFIELDNFIHSKLYSENRIRCLTVLLVEELHCYIINSFFSIKFFIENIKELENNIKNNQQLPLKDINHVVKAVQKQKDEKRNNKNMGKSDDRLLFPMGCTFLSNEFYNNFIKTTNNKKEEKKTVEYVHEKNATEKDNTWTLIILFVTGLVIICCVVLVLLYFLLKNKR